MPGPSAGRTHRIQAVFFDFGGTLVDEQDIAGWVDEALRLGLDLSPDDLSHVYADVLRETDRPLRPPFREFWKMVLEGAAQRPVPPGLVDRFVRSYQDRERPLPLFSDTRRCLEELRAEGRRLGVISNSRGEEFLREMLRRRGIGEFFDTLVSSGTEGVSKPDPEIFRRALGRLKVSPGAAFYVGDLAFTDAKSAAAVGMHSVWLNRGGTGFGEDPPEVTSLLEIPGWVRSLEGTG